METQLTAVEWLMSQLEGDDSKIVRVIGLKKYNSIIQQARAMEKEQSLKMLPHDLDELAHHNSLSYTWLEFNERDKTLISKYSIEAFKAGFQKALELLTFKSE